MVDHHGGDMEEHMHQQLEADDPVTRRECYLHRQVIERRVGSVERDIFEMRVDIKSMKENMEKFFDSQEDRWVKLWYFLIVIALLVAAGRVFDIDKLMGLV